MSTQVAGVLRDPFERPLGNTDIDIRAITNTFAVLPGATVKVTTSAQGEYNFILEPGNYAVSVILDGRAVYQGAMAITSTTAPGTLPQLLKQAEMLSELPLNYAEYFQQVQSTVKDDADRAQSAADGIDDQVDEARQYAQQSQASAQSSQQSSQASQQALADTQVIANKFQNLDEAVTETQQNAQQTQSDATQTASDRAAADSAAQRAEDAASSAETVNERNIRVPQNETINALPDASTRARSVVAFDAQGNSVVKPLSELALLDSSGKVPLANIPAAAITDVFPVNSQAAMLALDADPGDVAKRSDIGRSFILMSSPATTLSNWVPITDDVFLQLGASDGYKYIGTVNSFADLRALVPAATGIRVKLKGWSAGSDIGGGEFISYLTSATDNGGTIASNGGSYYWQRVGFDRLTPQMFGAMGNNVRDDVESIKSAIKESFRINKTLYIPDGDYICSTGIDVDLSTTENFNIVGHGSAFSRLFFTGTGYGFNIYRSQYTEWDVGSVHIRGMSIITNNANSGTAIKLNQNQITGIPTGNISFYDLQIRGQNMHSHQWAIGILCQRTTGTTFRDVEVYGYAGSYLGQGFVLEGTTDDIVTQHIIENCRFWFLNESVKANAYIQGIFFVNSNVFNCNYGIVWNASSEQNGQTELHIVDSQMTVNKCAINLTRIGFIAINSTMFISNQGSGSLIFLRFDSCWEVSVLNNNFFGGVTGNNIGIEWANSTPGTTKQGSYPSIITANTFDALSQAILVNTGAEGLRSYHNVYTASVTTRWQNNSGIAQCREETVFRSNGNISFNGTTALQQFAVAVPAGIFSAAPTMAELVWNGDYVMYATYNQATSTATSIVFNVRRMDAGAVTGGPYAYAVRATE